MLALFKEKLRSLYARIAADRALAAVIIIHIIFCGYFLYLNLHTGIFGDDYGYMYAFSFAEKMSTDRIHNLMDVLRSQYAHYFLMNGREVPHTLLQVALIGGRPLFAVMNTLFYFGLFHAMYQI
ncbi:MAG: hypothetical protein IJC18_03750, partial [Clostridia bacterium]|nr:hypothetical protein [Clostridia bacterium]